MADSEVAAAIAAGAGILGAAVGAFATLSVEALRLKHSERATMSERAEANREARRNVYVRLLGACDELAVVITTYSVTRALFEQWWRDFQEAVGHAEILGTPGVLADVQVLSDYAVGLRDELRHNADDVRIGRDARVYWEGERAAEFGRCRARLLNAMRQDLERHDVP